MLRFVEGEVILLEMADHHQSLQHKKCERIHYRYIGAVYYYVVGNINFV